MKSLFSLTSECTRIAKATDSLFLFRVAGDEYEMS